MKQLRLFANVDSRVWLAAMALLALAVRIGVMCYFTTYNDLQRPVVLKFGPTHDHFAFGYETGSIARSIATGKGFSSPFGGDTGPTAWIAPIYPYLCALIFKLFGVFTQTSGIVILSLNILFEALTCIYIVRIGQKTLGERAGWAAGWVWAVGVLFTRWATTWVWDMSLSALLLAVAVDQTLSLAEEHGWRSWGQYGLTWGVIALSNPTILSVMPVCAVWLIYKNGIRSRQFVRNAQVASAAFCVLIMPWLGRNRVVFHQWVFIRSNAPFEFSLGNYSTSNGLGWFGRHPTQNKRIWLEYKQQGELTFVAEKSKKATAWVRSDPGSFLRLCAKRFYDFWYGTMLDYEPGDIWQPWMYYSLSLSTVAGIWLALRRRVAGSCLIGSIIVCFPAAYYITFTHPRYRHTIEPLMLLVTFHGLFALVEVLRSVPMRIARAGANEPVLADAEGPIKPLSEPVLPQ